MKNVTGFILSSLEGIYSNTEEARQANDPARTNW